MENSTRILGVKITTESEDKILEYVVRKLIPKTGGALGGKKIKKARSKIIIFTPNPEQISAASRNPELKNLLNEADIALPDGMGVVWAARLLGKPIEARISGIDFMQNLVKRKLKRPVVIGCFGGQAGVAEDAAKCLQKMASSDPHGGSKITIGYASDIYDRAKMMQSDIDILFVGLGFPKQERWIIEHKDEIPATVIMACGGSFDFLSGRIRRAPFVIRRIGLEWLFRLMNQPARFFRQLQIWHFGGLILLEALSSRIKKLRVKK